MYRRTYRAVIVIAVLSVSESVRAGAGDTCDAPIVIGALPFIDSGNTCIGFTDQYEACASASSARDAVYRYNPPVDQCVRVSLCNETFFDTQLYAFASDNGSCQGVPIACNDNNCPKPANLASRIGNLPLGTGNTYWFVVDGTGNACGNFQIRIVQTAAACDVNADCDDGNGCTNDTCNMNCCVHAPVQAGSSCDDGNGCTDMDTCSGIVCSGTPVPGCTDCNANGVPDPQDIMVGTSDDCNLNGAPDECDIADATSDDVNQNGVPDECSFWDPPPQSDELWSTEGNWDPPTVPNNNAKNHFSVVIRGANKNAILDIAAEVDTVALLEGATLNVTRPIVPPAPDLTVVAAGGIFNRGKLYVARDRHITITSGGLRIAAGGVYSREPDAALPVTAELTAQRVIIREGIPGGEMILDSSMSVVVHGNLVLDGTPPAQPAESQLAGTCTPPLLRVRDDASLNVDGNAVFNGDVDVAVESSGVTRSGTAAQFALEGAFDNRSRDALIFDWTTGNLTLDGTTPQPIEVAGEDRGADALGFVENFAMGRVEVASGAHAIFKDTFDNQANGQAPCTEALYVSTLTLRGGATVVVDNCRVFYDTLLDEGATLITNGDACAGLFPMIGDCDSDGDIDLDDYAFFVSCQTLGQNLGRRVDCQCADFNQDGNVDLLDWRWLQIHFTGSP